MVQFCISWKSMACCPEFEWPTRALYSTTSLANNTYLICMIFHILFHFLSKWSTGIINVTSIMGLRRKANTFSLPAYHLLSRVIIITCTKWKNELEIFIFFTSHNKPFKVCLITLPQKHSAKGCADKKDITPNWHMLHDDMFHQGHEKSRYFIAFGPRFQGTKF